MRLITFYLLWLVASALAVSSFSAVKIIFTVLLTLLQLYLQSCNAQAIVSRKKKQKKKSWRNLGLKNESMLPIFKLSPKDLLAHIFYIKFQEEMSLTKSNIVTFFFK